MRRRRVWLIVLVSALVLFVVVLAAGSLPGVCASCHRPQDAAMAKNAHASTDCYDCHLNNGAWGFSAEKNSEILSMYPQALIGRGLTHPARLTSRSACLECHAAVLDGAVSANGLKIEHASCAPGGTCDTCHSTVAHGKAVRWSTAPVMDDCIACHKLRGASQKCEACHTGEPGGRQNRQNTTGAWQVTHGANWRKTHGLGDTSTCSTCHPANFCARCHSVPIPHGPDFGATHGAFATKDEAACLVCHPSEQDFCTKCHQTPMPHPAGFLEAHHTIAKGFNDPACIRCHVDTDCVTCHEYHVHPGQGPKPTTQASAETGSQ